jgi:hypothetical protein
MTLSFENKSRQGDALATRIPVEAAAALPARLCRRHNSQACHRACQCVRCRKKESDFEEYQCLILASFCSTKLGVMATSICDWCIQRLLSGLAPEEDSGILIDVALLSFLVRFAAFFPPLSLRQRLPRLGQLAFPSKLRRRFLQGCVVATTRRLVTAPASVFVAARKKVILRNRIFARVMSGFVAKEEVRLQSAAAARIAKKWGVGAAVRSGDVAAVVRSGDVADVLCYIIVNANCVNERGK